MVVDINIFQCSFCGCTWKARLDVMDCKSCGNTRQTGKKSQMNIHDQIDHWIFIGLANPWIAGAYDPPLNRRSFMECYSIDELKDDFARGNYSLGQAFYFKNLCFINQVNGGDEWLTIRDNIAFESITTGRFSRERFKDMVKRMLAATDEQLKRLAY